MKLYYLIPISGIIIAVVMISFMLLYQIEREKESTKILDLDKNVELIRNCQAGKYVKTYALGYDSLKIDSQRNENCTILIQGEIEGGYSISSCEIPMNEMQNFQGMKSFYYEPEGNFVKYCENIEAGSVWDKISKEP